MKKLSFFLSFVLCCAFLLSACNQKSTPSDFTLKVESEWGQGFSEINVRIYADKELTDLVWAQDTDSDGTASFKAIAEKEYYATLENVPTGYETKDCYTITEKNSSIVLKAHLLPEESLSDFTFGLGSVAADFSLTDINGNTYKLSELLKTKKAVVLNFWFMNCGPCKLEFPYLESAYGKYADSLEVIAINPVDGTNDTISAYAENNSLTFPMAKGEAKWESAFKLNAYPTTVVIDRYGVISMIHMGAITGDGEFEKIFDFFTSEDYTHTTIRNLSDIK